MENASSAEILYHISRWGRALKTNTLIQMMQKFEYILQRHDFTFILPSCAEDFLLEELHYRL